MYMHVNYLDIILRASLHRGESSFYDPALIHWVFCGRELSQHNPIFWTSYGISQHVSDILGFTMEVNLSA